VVLVGVVLLLGQLLLLVLDNFSPGDRLGQANKGGGGGGADRGPGSGGKGGTGGKGIVIVRY
jgi:hypothetical protein